MEMMRIAEFICTEKNGKEFIICGIEMDDFVLKTLYDGLYNSDKFDTLYISSKPITRENKKYVLNFQYILDKQKNSDTIIQK